jgi:hypothetical protein
LFLFRGHPSLYVAFLFFFRFVSKQIYLFRLFRLFRNRWRNNNFLVSRNKPKMNRNRFSFGLFRFEPKFFLVCFENTLNYTTVRPTKYSKRFVPWIRDLLFKRNGLIPIVEYPVTKVLHVETQCKVSFHKWKFWLWKKLTPYTFKKFTMKKSIKLCNLDLKPEVL